MKTTLLAAIAALSLAATGTAFAGEGNGPDFPAYNAGITSHQIYATVPTLTTGGSEAEPHFVGRQVAVQSNVAAWDTGSAFEPRFTGLAAQSPEQSPEQANAYAARAHQGGQG